MSTKSVGTLTRNHKIYFIELGRNELGASTMVGISMPILIGASPKEIGEAILENLAASRILTESENKDFTIFERACANIGFKSSNDFFKDGAFVHAELSSDGLLFSPTKALGRKMIQHVFLEPVVSDLFAVETVGKDFLRAVKLCR